MNIHKRHLGFLLVFTLPLWVISGILYGGIWHYSNIVFVFVIVPLLDLLIGKDTHNVDKEEEKQLSAQPYYRLLLYGWLFVQTALLMICYYVAATYALAWYEWIGFTISTGLVTGGIGITVAHELGHKKSSLDRLASQFLLMQVAYMHFYIEHNRGHHVRVATPEDPATSRQGENFYAFWKRTVLGSWKSAWQLEKQRLQRQGKSVWSWHNAMLWYIVLPVIFLAAISATIYLYQPNATLVNGCFFGMGQSFVAFSLLEAVNYIEHYGLVRRRTEKGGYERVNVLHSWNASDLLSNWFLFQLQRHSDHHAAAHKSYQVLRHIEESPQLPFGYPTMILLALIPPLWFKLMDRRLLTWQERVYAQPERH